MMQTNSHWCKPPFSFMRWWFQSKSFSLNISFGLFQNIYVVTKTRWHKKLELMVNYIFQCKFSVQFNLKKKNSFSLTLVSFCSFQVQNHVNFLTPVVQVQVNCLKRFYFSSYQVNRQFVRLSSVFGLHTLSWDRSLDFHLQS